MRRHDDGMAADGVEVVRGGAGAEEVAAVVAVLSALGERDRESAEPTGYAAWRRARLAAVARTEGSDRAASD
jgi:Acyl-CoA carboxylase epsilon subunit